MSSTSRPMAIPRIPYTTPLPSTPPIPTSARTLPGAIAATARFLLLHPRTLLLTGAGLSVASGLSDYRGQKGTYTLNRQYRPIFYSEFISSHAARQRYWARSYFGWPVMRRAKPNRAHAAIERLRALGRWSGIITQNVDSLHGTNPPPVELHGALRDVGCLTCYTRVPRDVFQTQLERLNPQWHDVVREASEKELELRMNPDGDIDLPSLPFSRFRYPPCPSCVSTLPASSLDPDGAHISPGKATGVMKPMVTFFGEQVDAKVKQEADRLVGECDAVLVAGSSLATYSAWRLVRRAVEEGKGLGVVNLGGVRGEDALFEGGEEGKRLRVEMGVGEVLEGVVQELGGIIKQKPAGTA